MRTPIIWIATAAGAVVLIAGGTVAAVASGAVPTAGASSLAPAPVETVVGGPLATPAATDDSAIATDLEGAIAAALAEVGPGTVIDADTDDDLSHAYEIDIRLDSGAFVEVAIDRDLNVVRVQDDTDGDRDDRSDVARDDRDSDTVTDAAILEAASKAAVAHVGSGTVVSVETSDDADHAYEVEIDLGGGEDIDVELNEQFDVVKAD